DPPSQPSDSFARLALASTSRRFIVADFMSHTPGTFSWPALAPPDQQGAVPFYRGLFGWDLNDQPMGPTETYSMFQMRGKEVGAAYTMREEERQHGHAPH